MADVTIGGQVYSVTLPNFKKLKAAWKFIAAVQDAADPMESVDAILGAISVGSATLVTIDELEEALTPAEMPGLRAFINELMTETGLATPEDEAVPLAPAAASPSTATSTDSSTSLSPPAAEV